MKIDSKFLRGEPLERWVTYAEDFALLMRFPEPAEWQAALGKSPEKADEETIRAFIAGHVTDWRGLDDEHGEPIPFTPQNLLAFLRRDQRFGAWATLRLGDAASFRRPAGDCAPAPVRHEGEAANA